MPGPTGLPCSLAGYCTVGALGAHGPSAQAGNETRGAQVPGASGRHVPFFAPTRFSCYWKRFLSHSVLPALAGNCTDQRASHRPWPSAAAHFKGSRPGTPLLPSCAAFCLYLQRKFCRSSWLVQTLMPQTVIPEAGDQKAGGGDPTLGCSCSEGSPSVPQLQVMSADTGCISCYFCSLFTVNRGITTSNGRFACKFFTGCPSGCRIPRNACGDTWAAHAAEAFVGNSASLTLQLGAE